MPLNAPWRTLLLPAALAYTAFVVYGSLVPLDFQPVPWAEAWGRFRAMPWLTLGVGARADWVANILLFIPLAFFWLGVLWHRWHPGWRLAASGFVLAAAMVLSGAIEFAQVFFPPRTVSLNDLVAQALGALIGVAAWWAAGPRLARWIQSWRQAHGPWQASARWLAVWLGGLLLYNLLPLDLTLSPAELYHKWKAGRMVLVPFSALPPEPRLAAYELLTDVAIWVPAAWLWRLSGASFVQALGYTVGAAAGLEFLQLWVFSRVSDVTDILTAAVGAALGAGLAGRGRGPIPLVLPSAAWGGLAAAWTGVLVLTFWYPFDFRADSAWLAQRVGGLWRPPFTAYYFGTEFRAVTEVLHKLLIFVPLGWTLARALGRRAALALGAAAAAGVEAGQLFLPAKNPDFTDWLLETAGAAAGAFLAGPLPVPPERPRAAARPPAPAGHSSWLMPLAAGLALGVALWLASRLPFVPYNVRELIAGEYPLLSALALALTLLWLTGLPPVFAARAAALRHPVTALLVALPGHGVIAYLLLRLAVPLESLHDLVGSPTLGGPAELELLGRFLGLALAGSAAAFGAALLVAPAPPPLRWAWMGLVPPVLAVSYAVVVMGANTDNLTELLAHGARFDAFLWVWLAGFLLALGGYGAGAWLLARRPRWAPGLMLTSGPLGWGLLQLGLESTLVKYGQVFSALQFLLSSDRSHYAPPGELLLRFGLAWTLALATLACAAWLALRGLPAPGPRGEEERRKPRPQRRHRGGQARDVEMAGRR